MPEFLAYGKAHETSQHRYSFHYDVVQRPKSYFDGNGNPKVEIFVYTDNRYVLVPISYREEFYKNVLKIPVPKIVNKTRNYRLLLA